MDASRKSRWRTAAALGIVGGVVLTGCTGGGGSLTGADGGSGSTSSLVVITNESPWLDAYKKVVAAYEEQSGKEVELRTFPYDEMRTQMLNDIQSGSNTYDVYQLDEPFAPEFYANEWVIPFTDIDPSYKADPEIISYDNVGRWNAELNTTSDDGDLMAIPLNGNVEIFNYRTDVYDALGLDVPRTWDEVVSNGKEAQESGKTNYGYVLRTQGTTGGGAQITYDFLPLMYAYGADWFVQEGTDWTPNINTPEGIAAATKLRELAELGPVETTTIGQAQAIGAMQAGESAQAQLVAAAAPALENEANSNVVGKVGFAPLPEGDAGPGVASGVWALTVPAGLDAERRQAALDFITFVGSEKGQKIFTEAGGIPTREDTFEEADVNETQKAYLTAIRDSLDGVRKHVRYTFGSEMLAITENYLSQIAAGSISPEEGLAAIDAGLTDVIEKADLPMGGSQ